MKAETFLPLREIGPQMENTVKAKGERILSVHRAQVWLVTPKVGALQSPLSRPYDIK